MHIDLPSGLKTEGKVLCEYIRALDINARNYDYIESVSEDYINDISKILKACVDVNIKASDV